MESMPQTPRLKPPYFILLKTHLQPGEVNFFIPRPSEYKSQSRLVQTSFVPIFCLNESMKNAKNNFLHHHSDSQSANRRNFNISWHGVQCVSSQI